MATISESESSPPPQKRRRQVVDDVEEENPQKEDHSITQVDKADVLSEPLDLHDDVDEELREKFFALVGYISTLAWMFTPTEDVETEGEVTMSETLLRRIQRDVSSNPKLARIVSAGRNQTLLGILLDLDPWYYTTECVDAMKYLISVNPHSLLWKCGTRNTLGMSGDEEEGANSPMITHLQVVLESDEFISKTFLPWISKEYPWAIEKRPGADHPYLVLLRNNYRNIRKSFPVSIIVDYYKAHPSCLKECGVNHDYPLHYIAADVEYFDYEFVNWVFEEFPEAALSKRTKLHGGTLRVRSRFRSDDEDAKFRPVDPVFEKLNDYLVGYDPDGECFGLNVALSRWPKYASQ